MFKRYLCGAPLIAALVVFVLGVGLASAQTVVSPYTGQTVAQPNGGGQTVTNPTGQGVTQAGDGQTLTQPSAAQSINSPAEGTQTVTQPGQCIQQNAAGQDVTQPGQDVPQGVPAGSCGSTPPVVPPVPPVCHVNCNPVPPVCHVNCNPVPPVCHVNCHPQPPIVCRVHHCPHPPPVCRAHACPHPLPPPHPVVCGAGNCVKLLAFTGFDVWKLLLVGGLLVGAGAGTWRMARRVGPAGPNR